MLPARPGMVVRGNFCRRREEVSAISALSNIVLERVLEILSIMLLFGFVLWFTG